MGKSAVLFAGAGAALVGLLIACGAPQEELTPDQIAFQKRQKDNALLAQTVRNPRTGEYAKGKPGGTWTDAITQDPKTFNPVLSKDAETNSVIGPLTDALLDYDRLTRTWKPLAAESYEVKTDPVQGTMDVYFTLRDDLYWTTLDDPAKIVKVTADDAVFWYNEITGDPAMQDSGYAQQFTEMPNGTQARITIQKISDRRFVFHYPRTNAFPELSCNMSFGPKYIFEPAKKAKGAQGVLELWSVATNPKTIPGYGPYLIESYRPGIEVVLTRNPNYWRKDAWGQPLPYIEKLVYKFIPNQDTEKLKFLAGELDNYTLRPEDLDELVKKQKDYTVYAAGSVLSASFISWNQNPRNLDKKYLHWFTSQEFRQAMSCYFPRDRVIRQVYRGLGTPALGFFPKANPFYDPEVGQKFGYDPAKGLSLLTGLGYKKDAQGILKDDQGNPVEFDLMVLNTTNLTTDIGSIYADELKQAGIKLNLRQVDFSKLVESLSKTYDWQAVLIGLSGSSLFPTEGSNVWKSRGDLHLWNPHQSKPATPWEARIDHLYSEGESTQDKKAAQKIWTEFQQTILDQLPVMYTIHPDSFVAYRNKWGNVFPDTEAPGDSLYFFQKD